MPWFQLCYCFKLHKPMPWFQLSHCFKLHTHMPCFQLSHRFRLQKPTPWFHWNFILTFGAKTVDNELTNHFGSFPENNQKSSCHHSIIFQNIPYRLISKSSSRYLASSLHLRKIVTSFWLSLPQNLKTCQPTPPLDQDTSLKFPSMSQNPRVSSHKQVIVDTVGWTVFLNSEHDGAYHQWATNSLFSAIDCLASLFSMAWK